MAEFSSADSLKNVEICKASTALKLSTTKKKNKNLGVDTSNSFQILVIVHLLKLFILVFSM
jgi:hypothetical protein